MSGTEVQAIPRNLAGGTKPCVMFSKFIERFWGALQGAQIVFVYTFSYGAYVFWAPCKAPKSAQ